MILTVTGKPSGVTLSGVKMKNLSTDVEVTLNSNNITTGEGTITLNLSEGGGRQTLPDTWDDVTVRIFTQWSNGDIVYDDSSCVVPAPAIIITAPESFQYNQLSVILAVDNVPDGVSLSSVSVKNKTTDEVFNIPARQFTFTDDTITLNMFLAKMPDWNSAVEVSTVWSDESIATDDSICEKIVYYDTSTYEYGYDPDDVLYFGDSFDMVIIGVLTDSIVNVYVDDTPINVSYVSKVDRNNISYINIDSDGFDTFFTTIDTQKIISIVFNSGVGLQTRAITFKAME